MSATVPESPAAAPHSPQNPGAPSPSPAAGTGGNGTGPGTGKGTGTDGRDAVRRRELAAFLRSRRERIPPERVGLPRGQRRRTPGLRREEVAHLSAVGVTWYTWLEQGRDIRVSVQVLDSLARALMLDRGEREHLFALAEASDPLPPAESCPFVSDSARLMLRRMAPLPASLQNARYDVLAANGPYGQVFGELEKLRPEDRNCLWLLLVDPDWRELFLDRDEMLRGLVAKFRAAMAEHVDDPVWKTMLRRLEEASPEFRELWREYEVERAAPHVKRYAHPRAGLLRLEHRTMWLSPNPAAYRVVTFVPADEETERRLEWLDAQAPAGSAEERAGASEAAVPGPDGAGAGMGDNGGSAGAA